MRPIQKYPSTRHIAGSEIQAGDHGRPIVSFSEIAGRWHVVEEKIDGAQMGVSFAVGGRLWLQSRGHYLVGGSANEGQFSIVKSWLHALAPQLYERLADRYVLYGEVPYKKHSAFYDLLPAYFLEFDILDLHQGRFLSTRRRREMLQGLPVASVPVLYEGVLHSEEQLVDLVRPSLFKSPVWRASYEDAVREAGLDLERAWGLVDNTDLSEGLYIKEEDEDWVVRSGDGDAFEHRYKWVRAEFRQLVSDTAGQGDHVMHQPTVVNRLAPGVDMWAWEAL